VYPPKKWTSLFNSWFCERHLIELDLRVDGEKITFVTPNQAKQ